MSRRKVFSKSKKVKSMKVMTTSIKAFKFDLNDWDKKK